MRLVGATFRLVMLVVAALLIWMVCAHYSEPYLVPGPQLVLASFFDNSKSLPLDLAVTTFETVAGLALATGFSFLLAVAFYFVRLIEGALMPYAVALKSVPIVAMAPLLVVWAGNGLLGKVIMAAIVAFFPMLIGFRDGLHAKSKELDHLAKVWATKRAHVFFQIDLPLSVPSSLSAMKVAAPLSLVGAVVAEFSGANVGLGHLIIVAAYRADVALLFVGIIFVSVVGVIMYELSVLAETIILKQMRASRAD